MAIQISPHTENAPVHAGQIDAAPDAHAPDSESLFAVKSKKKDGVSNGIGPFAKILAGLLRKTGNSSAAAKTGGLETADSSLAANMELESSLAEDALAGMSVFTGASAGGKKSAQAGKTQTFRAGETEKTGTLAAVKAETARKAKAKETGSAEDEPNPLAALELLLNRQQEQSAMEGGENALDEKVPGIAAEGDENFLAGKDSLLTEKAAHLQTEDSQETDNGASFAKLAEAARTFEASQKPAEQQDLRKTEKEGKGKLEEARSRGKRGDLARDRLSIEVRDFRSVHAGEGNPQGESAPLRATAERGAGEDTTCELTLELRLPNQGQSAAITETGWEARSSQAFSDLLARELHQNFNGDIVRHASMILRDGGEGTIKLALKPESLGNVKISLEMAENKITGHIVVESEEALRAFEREVHSLEQAFKDSGFQSANLEMSLASNGSAYGEGAQQNRQGAEASPFFTGEFAASQYDAALVRVDMPFTVDYYQRETVTVNVLA